MSSIIITLDDGRVFRADSITEVTETRPDYDGNPLVVGSRVRSGGLKGIVGAILPEGKVRLDALDGTVKVIVSTRARLMKGPNKERAARECWTTGKRAHERAA